MANSFVNGLKRLFSTNVIVRKSPTSKGVKVVDSSKLQAYNQRGGMGGKYGVYRTQYSNVYGSAHYGESQYGIAREQLYGDYEVMDSDPILSSALDIYADESTTRNENGEILSVYSSDDGIKEILNNLYYDILNVDFNLWPWVRNLCKYGDFYLHLHISEEVGIINVSPLPSITVDRVEDADPENPYYVTFKDRQNPKITYENFEMAHFRLLNDQNFVPYGKSMLENARRVFKQLELMEDAMLIHRIMRAPSKRVFKIDIGNIPPNEVENYMQQIVNKMKKEPHIDEKTGEYDLSYNMQNMTEDFYLPVRGNNSNTEINELGGLQYDGTEDIEYLRAKLMAALKIPKAYLGYEESLSGKATLAQEDIRFARTIERIQRIIEGELTKIAIIHLYAQGYEDADLVNFSIKMNNPSTIYTREQIDIMSSKLGLVRDIRSERIFSETWIYDNIFDMTEDEIEKERERLLDDMWRRHRFEEIERGGNDPMNKKEGDEEGEDDAGSGGFDFMTAADKDPDDEFSDEPYGSENGDHGDKWDDEDFYGFGKRGGRPKDPNRYGKDDYVMGRDPIGAKGRTESLISRLGLNKIRTDNNGQLDLLSEEQILDDDK